MRRPALSSRKCQSRAAVGAGGVATTHLRLGGGSGRRLPPDLEPPVLQGIKLDACPPLPLPGAAAASGSRLFDYQMWCFGQDIALLPGNGLVQMGFTRHPPPRTEAQSASVYQRSLPGDERVTLWSFGVLYAGSTAGGLFLERSFCARYVAGGEPRVLAWAAERLRFPNVSTSDLGAGRELLLRVLDWLTSYERDVTARFGAEHRHKCLQRWHRAAPDVVSLDVGWQELREQLAQTWGLVQPGRGTAPGERRPSTTQG